MSHGCCLRHASRAVFSSRVGQGKGTVSYAQQSVCHSFRFIRTNARVIRKEPQYICFSSAKSSFLLLKRANYKLQTDTSWLQSSVRFLQIPATASVVALPGYPQQFCATIANMTSLHQRRYVGEVTENVKLTAVEERLFSTLKEVVGHFGLALQLRVAGGWVRDKLIGKDSHDIDIALDNMMGEEFAKKVNEFLKLQHVETRNIGVIKSNPDQSKHLETATMQVHGQWIDFVNLRAETYADNSRIPDMAFGSAEEDAFRRDLTINSLFYNISTGEVEDLTGRGISDLKAGIVRTPLPPVQTFLDDPLRVLRSVRFAARFGFAMDEELVAAARLEEVRSALAMKVSKERIGKEVEQMLGGRDPVLAMHHLAELHLFPTIFMLPAKTLPQVNIDFGRRCVAAMAEVSEVLERSGWAPAQPGAGNVETKASFLDEEEKICTLLAGLLLPLRKTYFLDKKKKQEPVSSAIIREGLKQKTSYAEKVAILHSTAEEWQSLGKKLLSVGATEMDGVSKNRSENCEAHEGSGTEVFLSLERQRVLVGFLIRKVKRLWRPALLISSVLDHSVAETVNENEENKQSEEKDNDSHSGESSLKRMRSGSDNNTWQEMERLVMNLGLDRAWEIKPLLDGRTIIQVLNLKNAGPLVGQWAERAMEWQLAHPDAPVEQCTAWLKEEYSSKGEVLLEKRGGKSR